MTKIAKTGHNLPRPHLVTGLCGWHKAHTIVISALVVRPSPAASRVMHENGYRAAGVRSDGRGRREEWNGQTTGDVATTKRVNRETDVAS